LIPKPADFPQCAAGRLARRAVAGLGEAQSIEQRRLGAAQIASADLCVAQFQQGIDVRSIVCRGLQGQRLLKYRHRVPVLAEAVIDGADRGQQCSLGRRLVLKRGLQPLCAGIQELPCRDLIAAVLFGIR
jgi:hypothetical protein